MVEAIFYVLRTAVRVAGSTEPLRAMELGLHPVATLVRVGLVAGNRRPAFLQGNGTLALYRRPHIKLHQFGIGLGHEEGLGAVAHRVGPCPTAVRESTVKRYRTEIARRKLGPLPLWWHHRVMKMDLSSAPTDRWAEEEW
jgi:hypothetical protein